MPRLQTRGLETCCREDCKTIKKLQSCFHVKLESFRRELVDDYHGLGELSTAAVVRFRGNVGVMRIQQTVIFSDLSDFTYYNGPEFFEQRIEDLESELGAHGGAAAVVIKREQPATRGFEFIESLMDEIDEKILDFAGILSASSYSFAVDSREIKAEIKQYLQDKKREVDETIRTIKHEIGVAHGSQARRGQRLREVEETKRKMRVCHSLERLREKKRPRTKQE